MKYSILLLLLPLCAAAQTEPVPPKKAKKIYVSTSDSMPAAIGKVALVLFDRGYAIEDRDERLGLISSTDKSLKRWAASMKVRVRAKDSIIIISGVIALDISIMGSHRSFDDIYFGGAKWSPLRDSWNELIAIAKEIGTIIKYE